MKLKLILSLVLVFIFISCKKESKENNTISEPLKITTEKSLLDSINTDSIVTISSSNDLAQNKKMLLDFYIKNDKKTQVFNINSEKDTTIICAEKTQITIKANSFVVSGTGNDVKGKITISVKEYYNISDILLGRLSTVSNGKLLETGGMLHISAASGQEKCDLKKGKNIEIGFPVIVKKDDMQLFTGVRLKEEINWNVDKKSIDLNKTFTNVDERPVYIGGNEKMYKFIGRNFRTPEDNTAGKVHVSFVIDKEGNATNIKIAKSLNTEVDAEAIRVIKLLGKFTPGKINGIPVNCNYLLPITIASDEDGESSFAGALYNSKYTIKTAEDIEAEKISYYLFSSEKLGFINCDRFYDYPYSMKTNYIVDLGNETGVNTSIIFHSFKSVMNGYSDDEKVVFYNVPSKEKITLFAIKYTKDKLFLATKETIIGSKEEMGLTFHPVTQEDLKLEMKKLNVFN